MGLEQDIKAQVTPETLPSLSNIFAQMQAETARRYARMNPELPSRPTTTQLAHRFRDAASMYDARDAVNVMDKALAGVSSKVSFEESLTSVINDMSLDDIRRLPDSFRLDMLQLLNRPDAGTDSDQDSALWSARARLTFGEDLDKLENNAPIDFKGQYAVGYSPEFSYWLNEQENRYFAGEREMFENNPSLKNIAERWKEDPDSVSNKEKAELIQSLHNLHSEVNGYLPVPIVSSDMEGRYKGMFLEVAFPDKPGEKYRFIALDENTLENAGYDEMRRVILHESDHVAHNSWIRERDRIAPDDPRQELFRRMASYYFEPGTLGSNTGIFGPNPLFYIFYNNDPTEIAARIKHDPQEPPVMQPAPEINPRYKPESLPGLAM